MGASVGSGDGTCGGLGGGADGGLGGGTGGAGGGIVRPHAHIQLVIFCATATLLMLLCEPQVESDALRLLKPVDGEFMNWPHSLQTLSYSPYLIGCMSMPSEWVVRFMYWTHVVCHGK